jgi:hypothetical protein
MSKIEQNFFKGTSLEGKAKVEIPDDDGIRIPIDLTTAKPKHIKYRLLEMDFSDVDVCHVHSIVDLSDDTGCVNKIVHTFSSYQGLSQKLKSMFDKNPFWRIAAHPNQHKNFCYIVKERADQTEIPLSKGIYKFTLNPKVAFPTIIVQVNSIHGTVKEKDKMIYIRKFFNKLKKERNGEL